MDIDDIIIHILDLLDAAEIWVMRAINKQWYDTVYMCARKYIFTPRMFLYRLRDPIFIMHTIHLLKKFFAKLDFHDKLSYFTNEIHLHPREFLSCIPNHNINGFYISPDYREYVFVSMPRHAYFSSPEKIESIAQLLSAQCASAHIYDKYYTRNDYCDSVLNYLALIFILLNKHEQTPTYYPSISFQEVLAQ